MRTFLQVAFVWIMLSGVADGATLYLRWEGQTGNSIDLMPREAATVEVWVDLIDGESLSGVYFGNGIAVQAGQMGLSANPTGWTVGGTGDGVHLGGGGQQASFCTPGTNVIAGPGSFLVGRQTVRAISGNTDDIIAVSFDHAFVGVLDNRGDAFIWDNRFNTSFAGFVAYGDYGNPGWTGGGPGVGQPTPNPLLIHLTGSSPPDFDDDGDIDLLDLATFEDSLAGPGVPPTADPATDMDGDGDADLADYVIMQRLFTGEIIASAVDPCITCVTADVDLNGIVDGFDLAEIRLIANWHVSAGTAGNPNADADGSGIIDGGDIAFVHSSSCWTLTVPCE